MAYHPFKRLGLKSFSLALAAVLWAMVSGDKVVERSVRVPLEYQNVPKGMDLIGTPPETVDVRVRGASVALASLGQNDVVVVLNLEGARPGSRLFHLTTTDVRTPFGVDVMSVQPSTVSLQFERVTTRMVRILPAIEGDPAPGFLKGRVTVEPPVVEVIGPETRVDALVAASTDVLEIERATASIREELTVGVVDSSVRLREPRRATVTVDVVPAEAERTVTGITPVIAGLSAGRSADTDVGEVTIVVRGRRGVVETLGLDAIHATLNVAGLGTGRHDVQIMVEPGQGWAVAEVSPASAAVVIRE